MLLNIAAMLRFPFVEVEQHNPRNTRRQRISEAIYVVFGKNRPTSNGPEKVI